MRWARLALALALAISIGGCYLSHEREVAPSPAPCDGPALASCDAWEADGEPYRLSADADPGDYVQLGSAVRSSCGALVSWVVVTSEGRTSTVRHFTRALAGSGEPTGPIVPHPGLTHDAPSWSAIRLAAGGSRVGGLAQSGGACTFVPLDEEGREVGAPVELARDVGCTGFDVRSGGFSFVESTLGAGATSVTLVAIDARGSVVERTALPLPAGRVWWSRTRFEDGSFLSYSFSEDLLTTRYTGWLQRFDESGEALAEEVELGENGVPVHAAPTEGGALAAWMTAASGGLPARLRPIDRDGAPRGPTRDLPATGALYGLAVESTPDGGALAAWEEYHFDDEPAWRFRVQSLGPDATARGAPATVSTGTHAEAWRLLVDPSGARALLAYSYDGRTVNALPLRCAP